MNNDEYIAVRGLPIKLEEIALQQYRLGANLFDESVFSTRTKKIACANVLVELDKQFARSVAKKGPLGREEIRVIDIGDPSWLYIPIMLMPPGGNIIVGGSKNSPAGKPGWFRMRKGYKRGRSN